MKILGTVPYILPLFTIPLIITFITTAAFSQSHIHLGLPDGAKARFGKGSINLVKYFPDGIRFAVATSIGTWIYNVNTGEVVNLLLGHTAPVKTISFSPDGKIIATGSKDRTIKLWDTSNGNLISTCIGHKEEINLIAFSPDGKSIASTSADWKIRIWNVQTGNTITTISECGAEDMCAIVYLPDGDMLLTIRNDDRDESYIEYWNSHTGEFIDAVLIETSFETAAISPDCKILAGTGKYPLRFWDLKTGKLLKNNVKEKVSPEYMEFSVDGSKLVTGERWESICVWDTVTGKLINSMSHGKTNNSVTYSPDGKTIVGEIGDGTINVWDSVTGKLFNTISGHSNSSFYAVAISPDGNMLSTGGESEVQFWNTLTGEIQQTIKEPRCDVHSLSYSSDGKFLATAGTSMKARLWEAQTGRFLGSFSQHKKNIDYRHQDNVPSVAFSPDGSILATGGTDNQVNLWEIRTGEQYLIGERLATFSEHTEAVTSVAFSPDGKMLASGSQDKTIQIWNTDTRTHLKTFTGHDEGVTDVVFSPDGTTLASGSEDGTICLWITDTDGLVLPPIEGAGHITSLDYSPDGSLLASGTLVGNAIHIWDAKTGQKLHTFTGHTQRVNDVVFSSDGTTLGSVYI